MTIILDLVMASGSSHFDQENGHASRSVVAFCVRSDFDGVVSIISVAGELDIATSPQLQSELDLAFRDGAQHVLIDLTETDFVETG